MRTLSFEFFSYVFWIFTYAFHKWQFLIPFITKKCLHISIGCLRFLHFSFSSSFRVGVAIKYYFLERFWLINWIPLYHNSSRSFFHILLDLICSSIGFSYGRRSQERIDKTMTRHCCLHRRFCHAYSLWITDQCCLYVISHLVSGMSSSPIEVSSNSSLDVSCIGIDWWNSSNLCFLIFYISNWFSLL